MPRRPNRPDAVGDRIFRTSQAPALGLTEQQLRGRAWKRLLRSVYVDGDVAVRVGDDDHALRANAATAIIPSTAVIAGRSAAYLYGIRQLPRRAPVEVMVSPADWFGPVKGLVIWRSRLADCDVISEHPRRTTPLRTAWDIACRVALPDAVAMLDAMLADGLVSHAELVAMADEVGRWRRHRARSVIDIADAHAESPQESRLRAMLIQAGLPRPKCQHVVVAGARSEFVARVDLAWPQQRVAVEYDGHWHGAPEQLRHDRARLNKLVTADWRVIHVTDDRLRRNFPSLVQEIEMALEKGHR